LGWIGYAILAWGLVAWRTARVGRLDLRVHLLNHPRWELLVTAVPVRYPRWFGPYAGRVSDGYRIVRLFRSS
jgi:hypothetical protein